MYGLSEKDYNNFKNDFKNDMYADVNGNGKYGRNGRYGDGYGSDDDIDGYNNRNNQDGRNGLNGNDLYNKNGSRFSSLLADQLRSAYGKYGRNYNQGGAYEIDQTYLQP